MPKSAPRIGYVTGHAAEHISRLNMLHMRFMQYAVYRMLATFLFSRKTLIGIPYLWLLLFFLIPFVIVLKMSFAQTEMAMPPYTPLLEWVDDSVVQMQLYLGNYSLLFSDDLYYSAYLSSLKIAFFSTIFTLLIGYPIAYGMSRAPKEWRFVLVMMVILPFWTSFLIRVYAWIGILKPEGLLSQLLLWLNIIDQPLQIMNTNTAVYIGIVYSYLPFMILPLYATLDKMDLTLLEAAQDLGCPPLKSFWVITLPLSMPGVLAGCFLVFIPSLGEFVIPDLLGGSDTLMIGKTLWDEFFSNRDWPLSSAVAAILLCVLIIPIMLFQQLQQKQNNKGA